MVINQEIKMKCIFCNIKEKVLENDLAFAIYDKYPVSLWSHSNNYQKACSKLF